MSRAGGGRGGAAGVSPALAAAFLLAALTLWIAPNGFGSGPGNVARQARQ